MYLLFLECALAVTIVAALNDGTQSSLFDSRFDALVEQLIEDLHVPGLSVALIQDQKITSKGYGFAELPSTQATADTLWYTGSTTKAFTAAAAGMLVQDKKHPNFKWTSRLSDLLPGVFALNEDYQTLHTTLEDALSHRSGLPRHDMAYGWNNASITDIVRTMRHLPLTAEPRTTWQYCNLMFGTVGAVLEHQTGRSIETILREWIWKPLGMNSTTFSNSDATDSGNLARGYNWEDKGGFYVPDPYIDIIPIAAAGATISSVNDYALWMKALLSGYKSNEEGTANKGPLKSSLIEDLWTPRSFVLMNPSLEPVTYSLGWVVLKVGRHTVITHSGGLPGFGTNVFLVPEKKLGFVAVGNNVDTAPEVGSLLFLFLLEKLGLIFDEGNEALNSLRATTSISSLKPDLTMWRASRSKSESPTHTPLSKATPSDFTGMYTHPGYGGLNISIATHHSALPPASNVNQVPFTNAEDRISLQAVPSKRFWPFFYTLRHSHNNIFKTKIYWALGADEGCGSNNNGTERVSTAGRKLDCRSVKLWDEIGSGDAVFEHGLNGEIERLGIEMEEQMVMNAEESDDWREGMIWFEKVD